jgi:hypothetical protein
MSLLVSQFVSVRVPTCPLKRAKLDMSDTIFCDRHMREVLGGSDCEPPMVRYPQYEVIPNQFSSIYRASFITSPLALFNLFQNGL